PNEILDVYGADALRWHFSVSPPWIRRPLSKESVEEMVKKFMGTLHNVYSFFVLYANIDNMNPNEYELLVKEREVIDRWIISLYENLVKNVHENMDTYQINKATRGIADFVDELSNWYVRRCRDRYWGSETTKDKIAAYKTLYEVLVGLSKLISPFVPFMAEDMYQNLVKSVDSDAPESVHLCDYPVFHAENVDATLEADMDYVRKVVVLARAGRNRANAKTRQPLAFMLVNPRNDDEKKSIERLRELIVDEINIKEIKYTDDMSQFVTFSMKPIFNLIGKKYGKLVPKIGQALSTIDVMKARTDLETDKVLKLDIDGEKIELLPEEIEIRSQDKEGYITETDNGIFATLSTTLTKELIEEGFAREIINKIQFMRKEADFNVVDRIKLYVKSDSIIYEVLNNHRDYIMNETLTIEMLEDEESDMYIKEWSINGEMAIIGIKQMHNIN
ncbi:MAG: isoleucyl-tRNA synthetase, partial [Candidatus Poribacteria bacterium]|nr:isoleucyl-tRNA synthetase [Candidatus Poribacteria bacterium]